MTRKTYSYLLPSFLIVLLALTACDLTQNALQTDRDANLQQQDFRDAFMPRNVDEDEESELVFDDSIPDFEGYITEPSDDQEPTPLVSLSVNQTVPLRDVLFELAKQADMDVELDPNIKGSVILTARNKPFDVVIKRISEMAGLTYTFEDNILRIENDYPYQETYQLEYLNILRNTETNVTTSIRIGSTSTESGGETDTGSDYSLSSTSDGDFWTEIEANITHILTEDVNAGLLKTADDPSITVSQPAPIRATSQGQTGSVPTPTLNVQSLPASSNARSGGRSGGRGGAGEEDEPFEATFSINRQSGILTVYAPKRLQKKVDVFLERIKELITSQVLIEAKVLEVDLIDEYSTGVNWEGVFSTFDASFLTTGSPRPSLTPEAASNFSLAASIGDVDFFVDALSRFGTVRALASPRITVLNNQPAALNVTESRVYFEIEVETEEEESDNDGANVEITSDTFSVPEGVIINVHPSINLNNNTTILSIKPTVTRVVNFVEDPAAAAAVAIAQSETTIPLGELQTSVPELSVQEFDSIIKLKSGEVAVLGGLLEDRIESTSEGVPIASELPLFGSLFRSRGDSIRKTELVVLIKTTILNSASENIHQTDREFYKKFSGDRRPFKL